MSGANALELQEMQDMALGSRQVVRQFETRLEQSKKDLVVARAAYYPSVDLGYTMNHLDEASFVEDRENSVVFGSVSYNLFAGLRDKYTIDSAGLLSVVEDLRLESLRQDIQLAVALAYLDVYERLANKKVAESAFETLEKVYRDGESRYEVGLIGKNELLKFRVDYDNADITLKAADAGLKKSINNLSRQVGNTIDFFELGFQEFSQIPSLDGKEQYREKMLACRSEIKALEKLVEAAALQAEAARGDYYPRVDAVGSYQRYDNHLINGRGDIGDSGNTADLLSNTDFSAIGSDGEEIRAQVVFSLNLFRGHATEATVARAKLETRAASYELDELKRSLSTELDNLYIDLQVSLENVEVANRSIEQAQENLRITQLKYEEGLQRESDLLDAITSLSRAKYNYVAVIRALYLNDFKLTRMIDGF